MNIARAERIAKWVWRLIWAFIALSILILVFCGVSAIAEERIPRGLGHPGSGGHWYDTGCCSLSDCEPVESGAITMRADGYHVRYLTSRGFIAEGTVPYGSSSIRPSKDHREHACSTTARILCIYLPLTM